MNKRFYLLLALVLGCVGMICALPSVGKIYYMKGKLSQKYLKASGTSLSLSAEKTTDCLFYVDADNAIKAYLTSNYINCSGKNLSTAKYSGVFSEGADGAYYYNNNSYYIYGGANTNATSIDRGSSYGNDAGYQWYFEEYTPPTVEGSVVDGKTYFIRSVTKSGNIYAYAGDATQLARSTKNTGSASYRWKATKVSDGVYTFQNVGDNSKYLGFKQTATSATQLKIASSNKRAECFTIWRDNVSQNEGRYMVGNVDVSVAWNQSQSEYNASDNSWSTDFQFEDASEYVTITYQYKEGSTLVRTESEALKTGQRYEAPCIPGYYITSVVEGTAGTTDATYEVPVERALPDVRAIIGDGTTSGGGCGIFWIGIDIPSADVDGSSVDKVPLRNIHMMSQTGNAYNRSYMVVSSSSTLSEGSVVAVSQNNPEATSSAAFVCYNFNKELLTPGGRYYLFFVNDKNNPTASQTNRTVLCSASKAYAPKIKDSNGSERSNWYPNLKLNVASIGQAMSTVYGEKWVTIDFVRDAGYSWKISGTAAGATPSNMANEATVGTDRQWCFVGTPQSFKIYSRAAGESLALTTNSESVGDGTLVSLTDAESACRWTVTANGAGYEIARVGESSFTLNSHGGLNKQIKYYNKGDNGAVWTINLLKTLTVRQSIPGVEGIYTWNGQTKSGSTVTFYSTSYVDYAPLSCSVVPGYTYSFADVTWNGATDKEVSVTLTPNFFTTQSDYAAGNDNVHWIRITHVNEPTFSPTATEPGNEPTVSLADLANEGQLWCFVGDNTNGFKIYSKAHPDYVLQAAAGTPGNGTKTTLVRAADAVESQSTWVLGENHLTAATKPGYTILLKDKPNFGLNKHTGYWRFFNASDAGSRWTMYEVGGELTINVNIEGNILPTNSKVGAISVTYNGQTTTTRLDLGTLTVPGTLTTLKVRAPKGAVITIADGNPKFAGYEFAGIDCGSQKSQPTISIDNVPVGGVTATVTYTANEYQNLFYTKDAAHPYRIPAIVKTKDGTLIAASDYRYCGGDVGNGRVDIVVRRSSDNGATWTAQETVAQGWRNADERPEADAGISDIPYGFGDATLVADDESGAVLLGYVGAPSSATCWTDKPDYFFQKSEDNGKTWGAKYSVIRAIKDKINAAGHSTKNFFVGSGKIVMSRKYKKQGSNYKRIYCVLWVNGTFPGENSETRSNWVVYSDDFGETWEILGGTCAAKGSCDEPKCEELPDGSVVLSSRESGCRWFNIFTYTDQAAGAGTWQTAVASNRVDGGLSFGGNATNGEIQVLRAVRSSDNTLHNLVLQSIPTGSSRDNVAIYVKNIDDPASYSTPTEFAKGWTRAKIVAPYASAYSTMCIQADGRIAFFYEDARSGAGYDMVYVPCTVSELTGDEYRALQNVVESAGSTQTTPILEGDVASTDDVTESVTPETSAVDLSQATITTSVSVEQIKDAVISKTGNQNTLMIVPPTATVDESTTNVIVDDGSNCTCHNLSLVDGGSFAAPRQFTATNATYTRTMTADASNFGTICLPYAVDSNGDIQYYELTSHTSNAMIFSPVGHLSANTPALYKRKVPGNVTASAANVEITAAEGEMVSGESLKMVGVFRPTSVVDSEGTDAISGYDKIVDPNCYYIKGGKFYSLNQRMNLKAFRAYITGSNNSEDARAAVMDIAFDDNVDTGIEIVESEDQTVKLVFDLSGRRWQKPQQGINIINGQKIISGK